MKYLIMTDKHRSIHGVQWVLFWGPNKSGYTSFIGDAGRYTLEEAKGIIDNEETFMISEEELGIPTGDFKRFKVLIEKGTVNDIVMENGGMPIFRR